MAKIGDITVRADSYFVSTRINHCLARDCVHNLLNAENEEMAVNCRLKTTHINEQGACGSFEDKGSDD